MIEQTYISSAMLMTPHCCEMDHHSISIPWKICSLAYSCFSHLALLTSLSVTIIVTMAKGWLLTKAAFREPYSWGFLVLGMSLLVSSSLSDVHELYLTSRHGCWHEGESLGPVMKPNTRKWKTSRKPHERDLAMQAVMWYSTVSTSPHVPPKSLFNGKNSKINKGVA